MVPIKPPFREAGIKGVSRSDGGLRVGDGVLDVPP